MSGLAPTRATLDNRAVVLAKDTKTTPAVTVHVSLHAGSVTDPVDAPGLTYLMSRVIDRGTTTRSADDIAEDLDSRATALAVSVTRHLLSIVCTCLAEDFEAVLALVADIVMAPVFPVREVATRKGEVVTAIRQDQDNPAVRATEALMALLYPDGHPYGRPAKGTVPVVEGISAERLRAHHARQFAPGRLSIAVVGDVAPGRAVEAAAHAFGSWRAADGSEVCVPPVSDQPARRLVVIPMMNKAQADIAYGFTAIARADPAYYAFWLMNNAFGQYAIGGRLGDSIRERQGMAYYVGSSLDANVARGPLAIRAGVSPANVDRAIQSIDEEIGRLLRDGLTERELRESRQFLIGSMPRALETNAGIANFLQAAEFFGLGLDYDVRLPSLLQAVTLDDTLAAARRVLDPARATIVVAGPYGS